MNQTHNILLIWEFCSWLRKSTMFIAYGQTL